MNKQINLLLILILSCSEDDVIISNTPPNLPSQNYKIDLHSNSGSLLESVTIYWNNTEGEVELDDSGTLINPGGSSHTFSGMNPGEFRDITIRVDDSTYVDSIQIFTRPVYPVYNFRYEVETVMRGNNTYDVGENFTDLDSNSVWNEGEGFVDKLNEKKYHRNLIWSPTLESQDKFSKYYIHRSNKPKYLMSCDCIIDSLSSILETSYTDSSSEVIDKSGIASFYYMVQVSAGEFTQNSFIYNYTNFRQPGPIQLSEGDVSTTKNDYIDISWESILDPTYFYQYEIYRAPDKGLTDITLIASIPNSSIEHFQDRNAGNGTTWYYSVFVRDIGGGWNESEYISGRSLP